MQTTGRIKVWNNGAGVPVEMHKKEQVYVPELIFGHLLTSSNYEDDQKKVRRRTPHPLHGTQHSMRPVAPHPP